MWKNETLFFRQEGSCPTLHPLLSGAAFDKFHRLSHQLVWLTITRPHILALVYILARMIQSTLQWTHITAVNETLEKAKNLAGICLSFPR